MQKGYCNSKVNNTNIEIFCLLQFWIDLRTKLSQDTANIAKKNRSSHSAFKSHSILSDAVNPKNHSPAKQIRAEFQRKHIHIHVRTVAFRTFPTNPVLFFEQ